MNLPFELSSPLVTTTEAAFFLRLSARTLEKYRVVGGGPQYRKLGRKVLYTIADLEAWANSHRCVATDDSALAGC